MALFTQTAFKQYEPCTLPTSVHAYFDKVNHTMGTFWVINKKNFAAVGAVSLQMKCLVCGAENVRNTTLPSLLSECLLNRRTVKPVTFSENKTTALTYRIKFYDQINLSK